MAVAPAQAAVEAYLEVGSKRTFAAALDWPGWSRGGRDRDAALAALAQWGPRYARVLEGTGLPFHPPSDGAGFAVVEQLPGDATTDFGAPSAVPAADARPMGDVDLERARTILRAAWRAFDRARAAAVGRSLRKGPRGGGRELDAIVEHVVGGDRSYLVRVAGTVEARDDEDLDSALARTRQAVLDALDKAVRVGLPERGPRGGAIWPPRYFVRRVAWHVLDHAWEIEDRVE